ncbi:MAG: FAD-dependent monooxygenase [Solirubrobacteraceae bacterium]
MRVLVVGGGPGGLYAASLIRKALGERAEVSVLERDPRGATYGWGVVLSEQTLGALQQADRPSYERIETQFTRWDAIDVDFRGVRMRAYGHGFSGLSRKALLGILEDRCLELGVAVCHGRAVEDHSTFGDYQLVVAADGLNSRVRHWFADTFRPSYDTRSAKYIWWGTSRRPDVFTYMVRPTEWGIFQGTPYPFTDDRSTFVVECSEPTWRAAGIDRMSEEQSKAFCEGLFADFLEGHPLLANRSLWLSFTTVRNQRWSRGNVVLLGDAAHTAHFTIGSGTKLAMEDAIALADALRKHERIPDALAYYENGRAPVIEAFQQAAQESLVWFENLDRSMDLPPEQFMFNFLTRSGRISYNDVRERDARFADAFDRWFAGAARASAAPVLMAPTPLFTPLRLGARTVPNRTVLTIANDLCREDAVPGTVHERAMLHRARGGAGVVMTDLLAVDQRGRVTPHDSGLYCDEQQERWAAIVAAVHAESEALVMARLGHAGARGGTAPRERGIDRPLRQGGWPLLAASARPHTSRAQVPEEMDRDAMDTVVEQFRSATERAARAGFDVLELHAGSGYLLAGFLSPLTNWRRDEYGGPRERRMRFPLEVFTAVEAAWPDDRPLCVCLTADDWATGGATTADAVALAGELKASGCDLVHLVAGQTVAGGRGSYGRHFLSGYGEWVRNEVGIPVMIRGRITSADEANTVIGGGRADLCIVDLPGLAELDARLRAEGSAMAGADAGGREEVVTAA